MFLYPEIDETINILNAFLFQNVMFKRFWIGLE